MDINFILGHVDHTLLAPSATECEIITLCDDAIKYKTASVCISPSFVKFAKEYVKDQMQICTVVGFPNGYNTTSVKQNEAYDAILNGADEIDMVINIGWLKDKKHSEIEEEIRKIKSVCGFRILKVIIETCLLTDEEKITMCKIVSDSGADYIKTSTGFSNGGATFEDIKLMATHSAPHLKIKAAGGIRSFEDAEKFILLGAKRLGTSSLVKLIKENKVTINEGY